MEFSAAQIANILSGEIIGNPDIKVNNLSKIEEGLPNTLSFLANPKYEEHIYTTQSSICIVNRTFQARKEIPSTLTLIKVDDAYSCFAKLLEVYAQYKMRSPKIEEPVHIAPSAKVGENCYIGAFSYIGENVQIGKNVQIYPGSYVGNHVSIGDNSTIYAGVKIYDECVIGKNCILHAGVVIGADGFGFAPDSENVYHKIPQIGNVILEDNIEIGANSTIDRSTMGSTIIRSGVKIDNLVQVAHNVEIGKNTVLASQVGVAGSAKIGENVQIGGQAGISGHIYIADGTQVVPQSGIPNNVKKAQVLMGSPGIPLDEFKKSYFGFRKLPYLLQKVRELETALQNIQKTAKND